MAKTKTSSKKASKKASEKKSGVVGIRFRLLTEKLKAVSYYWPTICRGSSGNKLTRFNKTRERLYAFAGIYYDVIDDRLKPSSRSMLEHSLGFAGRLNFGAKATVGRGGCQTITVPLPAKEWKAMETDWKRALKVLQTEKDAIKKQMEHANSRDLLDCISKLAMLGVLVETYGLNFNLASTSVNHFKNSSWPTHQNPHKAKRMWISSGDITVENVRSLLDAFAALEAPVRLEHHPQMALSQTTGAKRLRKIRAKGKS